MQNLSSALNNFLKKNGLDEKLNQYKVFDKWEDIVGKNVADNAKPIKIYQDTLVLKVENPTWKTELNFMKRDLLITINTKTRNKFKHIKII